MDGYISYLRAFSLVVGIVCATTEIEAAEPFSLSWPVACDIGRTCFVQNYFDHGRANDPKDYACGSRTYTGHDGTDIRLTDERSERKGVKVLAAAAGRVLRIRDGVDDVSIRVTGKAAVAGKECGNGLVIDHGQGWSTQYCHLQKGSLAVTAGQLVKAGDALGNVGLSGETEVPHLHLTVRYNEKAVDPFSENQAPDTCSTGRSLWATPIASALRYVERQIINFGFAGTPVTMELIESGSVTDDQPNLGSDVFVAYVRAIGLRRGDEQLISIRNPDENVMAEYRAPTLTADKAQFFVTAGLRRKEHRWGPGTYTATYQVIHDGAEVLRKVFDIAVAQ